MNRSIEHKAMLSERLFVNREQVFPHDEAHYTFHFAPREIKLREQRGSPLYDVQHYCLDAQGEGDLLGNIERYTRSVQAADGMNDFSEVLRALDFDSFITDDVAPVELPAKKHRRLLGTIASIDTVDCLVSVNKLGTPYFLLLSEANDIATRPNGNATTLTPQEVAAFGQFLLTSVPNLTR